MYMPITDFSTLRRLAKMPERFRAYTDKALAEGGAPVWLRPGTRIQFNTKIIEASGTVMSIDRGAVYPIKVEWFTADGDKRITSFSPDEFITLTIKE